MLAHNLEGSEQTSSAKGETKPSAPSVPLPWPVLRGNEL